MRKTLVFLSMLAVFPSSYAIIPVTDAASITVETVNGAVALANGVQIVAGVANDLIQIKNQVTMLKGLSSSAMHVSDVTDSLNNLQDMSSQGQSLTYATKDISKRFADQFGNKKDDKDKKQNNADRYDAQMQTILDTTQGTLKTAQQQMKYTQDETEGLKQITNSSNSAEGLRGVTQGTNQLLDASIAQMQRLSAMQAQRDSQDATIQAAKASQQQEAVRESDKFLKYKSTYKHYKADKALEIIPDFN